MFNVFDRYMTRQLLTATLVVSGSLSMIVMLAQSLRLIRVVLESGASASAFLTMMALSLPRFFEAVLPASVLISSVFILQRLIADSELVVMSASGASPLRLARPVLRTGALLAGVLLVLSLWVSPLGIAEMQSMKREVRVQYGQLLFREGLFNTIGKNLTAYVRAKAPDGRLIGLMVHDTRGPAAVTVVARDGRLVDGDMGQKIVLYDGSRQELERESGKFSRLDFKQYTLEIPPQAEDTSERWQEPDERTLNQLTDAAVLERETAEDRLQFRAELHRRFTAPVLMLAFAAIAAAFLLRGGFARGSRARPIVAASVVALLVQGLYLAAFNLAKKGALGCALLYGASFLPLLVALFFLTPGGGRLLDRIARGIAVLRGGRS